MRWSDSVWHSAAGGEEELCHDSAGGGVGGGEKNEPGTKNFSRAASDSSARSVGRKNTVGTESMETMVSISAEQRSSSETMSIFESGGSSGNSVIFIPRGVNAPVLSSAPSTQSWYMEVTMFSWGGGVHKRKFKEVLDTQGTEQQHHVGQVGALDFRDGRLEHLKLEGCLGVHPVAPCIELGGGGESVGEMDPNAGGCPFCLSLYPSDAFPDRSPIPNAHHSKETATFLGRCDPPCPPVAPHWPG